MGTARIAKEQEGAVLMPKWNAQVSGPQFVTALSLIERWLFLFAIYLTHELGDLHRAFENDSFWKRIDSRCRNQRFCHSRCKGGRDRHRRRRLSGQF